jgi:hypothetical protein
MHQVGANRDNKVLMVRYQKRSKCPYAPKNALRIDCVV